MENLPSYTVNNTTISLFKGDITQQNTIAIVNAANSSLLGGGGVDGAIHRAAGPELLNETRTLNGCKTGDAKITSGYNLVAKYVIHAVGPIYQPENEQRVASQLDSCYYRSLKIAEEKQISSIAFPAISTGIYGYPIHKAAPIAINAVIRFVTAHSETVVQDIRFVLFTQEFYEVFLDVLNKIKKQPS